MIIARAYPNRKYIFYDSISHIRLEARIKGNGVYFYSIENGEDVHLYESTVKSLLPTDVKIKRRPFNYKDNYKMWVVLNRKSTKYKSQYEELVKSIQPETKPDAKRKSRKRTRKK